MVKHTQAIRRQKPTSILKHCLTFQIDNLMLPFFLRLSERLGEALMLKFISKKLIEEATIAYMLCKLDVSNKI